jgi:hypothetical protein
MLQRLIFISKCLQYHLPYRNKRSNSLISKSAREHTSLCVFHFYELLKDGGYRKSSPDYFFISGKLALLFTKKKLYSMRTQLPRQLSFCCGPLKQAHITPLLSGLGVEKRVPLKTGNVL